MTVEEWGKMHGNDWNSGIRIDYKPDVHSMLFDDSLGYDTMANLCNATPDRT